MRSSHPKAFQHKITELRDSIDKLFEGDGLFRSAWSGDGLVVLFQNEEDYADELLKKSKKILSMLRTKKMLKEFSQPLRVSCV